VAAYDSLPPNVAFVHGPADSWHVPHGDIYAGVRVHAALPVLSRRLGYFGLNGYPVIRAGFDAPNATSAREVWERLVGPALGGGRPMPSTICVDGSLQFVASRARIRAVPREAWARLQRWAYDEAVFANETTMISTEATQQACPGTGRSRRQCVRQKRGMTLEFLLPLLLGEPPVATSKLCEDACRAKAKRKGRVGGGTRPPRLGWLFGAPLAHALEPWTEAPPPDATEEARAIERYGRAACGAS